MSNNYMFTKTVIEYIKDNTRMHAEYKPGFIKEFKYSINAIDRKEDWHILVDVIRYAKFKRWNYIDEFKLIEKEGRYHLAYKFTSEN